MDDQSQSDQILASVDAIIDEHARWAYGRWSNDASASDVPPESLSREIEKIASWEDVPTPPGLTYLVCRLHDFRSEWARFKDGQSGYFELSDRGLRIPRPRCWELLDSLRQARFSVNPCPSGSNR